MSATNARQSGIARCVRASREGADMKHTNDKQYKVIIRYVDQKDTAKEILHEIEEDYGYGGSVEEETEE